MKKLLNVHITTIIIVLLAPFVFMNAVSIIKPFKPKIMQKEKIEKIKVYVTYENKVVDMDFGEYLKCVVAAEMPAEYNIEALKAQAVAARTYALRKVQDNKAGKADKEKLKGADVSTDFANDQAFITKENAVKKWGENRTKKYWKKITDAVYSTKDEIIEYDNQPIMAVFHSISSGRTENCEDVWGMKEPYLKSVVSSFDDMAPNFETKVELSLNDFKDKIKKGKPKAVFKGTPQKWLKKEQRTAGGSVKSIEVGGVEFAGTELRTMFSLRSANFNIEFSKDKVIFNVKGYGHGVGMSQNGANYLANQGLKYDEILKKYYQNVTIVKI